MDYFCFPSRREFCFKRNLLFIKMNLIKKPAWILALMLALGPIPGCALFDRHQKNSEGYYERQFWACGPIALEKAFSKKYERRGIAYCVSREELSKQIQG